MKRILAAVAVAAVASFARSASAASAFTDVTVSANITNNCTIATASNIAFGAYDPVVANAAAPLDANGSVNVACTVGTAPVLELNNGANYDGVLGRRMSSGTDFLRYELYQDAPGGTRWGSVADAQALAIPAVVSTAVQTFTIYGRVYGGQSLATAGNYGDTVRATVQF